MKIFILYRIILEKKKIYKLKYYFYEKKITSKMRDEKGINSEGKYEEIMKEQIRNL